MTPSVCFRWSVFGVFVSLLISIVSATTLGSVVRSGSESQLVWCRMNEGVSRCVDPPFRKTELPADIKSRLSGKWCPFRVCGPSYIVTDPCPDEEEFKPAGQCSAKRVQTKVYTCKEKKRPDFLPPDVACNILGTKYCKLGAIYICQCVANTVVQVVYELKNSKQPVCPRS